jgi:hypothetical protein
MKYLNGAASVNAWVHYEHLDKLSYSEFKAFTKEIQMVQQQFIIQELSNESEGQSDRESSMAPGIRFENSESEASLHEEELSRSKVQESKQEQVEIPYSRSLYSNKVSFAVFGSFSYQFSMSQSKLYKQYCHAAQSGFRTLGLVKPDNTQIIEVILG